MGITRNDMKTATGVITEIRDDYRIKVDVEKDISPVWISPRESDVPWDKFRLGDCVILEYRNTPNAGLWYISSLIERKM